MAAAGADAAAAAAAPAAAAAAAAAAAPAPPMPGAGAAAVGPLIPPGGYPDTMSISVVPGMELNPENEVPVLVTVRTPKGANRTPSDICVVLDISGSMGTEAKIMGAGGTAESHGLSLLDVAKHGVRTVIKSLDPADRLTLVSFNTEAATVLPLTVMNEEGQKEAEEKLENVMAGGGTNIWNGLFAGMEALRQAPAMAGRLAHVMLLTDGESQERDKIVPNLEQYKQTFERLPGTISTFGFGYNIDSHLLVRLANGGDGSYSFIPDAGFVGTVFVNTLSNLLCTMAREVYLSLESEEGCSILAVHGTSPGETSSWGMRINIGTLQYEQTKDVIVVMRVAGSQPYLTVSGSYEAIGGGANASIATAEGVLTPDPLAVEAQCHRACFAELLAKISEGLHPTLGSAFPQFGPRGGSGQPARLSLMSNSSLLSFGGSSQNVGSSRRSQSGRRMSLTDKAMNVMGAMRRSITGTGAPGSPSKSKGKATPTFELLNKPAESLDNAQKLVKDFASMVESSSSISDPRVSSLLEDIRGQSTEAISREDWYRKWGRHYLPSIMFAHKLQQCNNFKDPGVQLYGGPLFADQRDTADDIFCKLPAPKPSARRMSMGAMPAAPINMAAYNDRFAG